MDKDKKIATEMKANLIALAATITADILVYKAATHVGNIVVNIDHSHQVGMVKMVKRILCHAFNFFHTVIKFFKTDSLY